VCGLVFQIYPEPVLDGLVLKCDHWHNMHKIKTPPLVEGAYNFRQAGDSPVYGICQPSAHGIRKVAHYLIKEKANKKIRVYRAVFIVVHRWTGGFAPSRADSALANPCQYVQSCGILQCFLSVSETLQ
jgi:hypothetical protein